MRPARAEPIQALWVTSSRQKATMVWNIVEAWPWIVTGVVLVIASVTDVRSGKIPNAVTLPAIAIGLIGHTLCGGLTGNDYSLGLVGSLIGLAVGFLPLWFVWKAGGIGGGDAKIMAAIGAITGWHFTLNTLFYGLIVAAVMAIAIIVRRRMFVRTMKRIGRFLVLALTPTRPADPALADSPKVAFGLALCIGAAIVLAMKVASWYGLPSFALGF